MSSTYLREHIKKVISKHSILFFAILIFIFNANFASATELNSCGEIAFGGEYELSTNIGTTSETCLIISASGVTINGTSTYSVLGNIVGNRTNYTLTNVVDTGDLSIFYYNNAAADGNWANLNNWWLDSAYTQTANRSGVTVPSTQDSVVINGNVSQISTGVASVYSARFINNATWNVSGSTITDGLVWTKTDNTIPSVSDTSSTNGRLPLGNSGRGDMTHAYPNSVIKDGSTYKMWYQGADNSYNRIFYATSTNGLTWTKYDNTVPSASDTTSTNGRIPVGTSGKGDANGVGSAQVLKEGSTYKMWYSGLAADGIWRSYYATSPDGLTWTKYDNTIPVASDTTSTNGRIAAGTSGKGDANYVLIKQVIKDGDLYKMWYRGYDGTSVRTYLATSPDGLTWTKYDNTVPSASDTTSTNGRIPVGTSGKGDDLHAQIPVIYKDGAMYKMFYSGYTSVGSFYSGFYASSPDGLTWTKYNNTIPSTSDTTSTDGRIPKGNAGRLDSTGVLLTTGLLDNNVFKIWYSGYSGTNWRGAYATASNSYRALNLSVNSAGAVDFEGNSRFGKGTISTADGNAVSEVNFTGSSIATEISIKSDEVNINTSTSTTGIFDIQGTGVVVNVDSLGEASTVNIVGSDSILNLNNSVNLNSIAGNNLSLRLNGSSSVDSFGLTGNSSIKFNTTYYHGSNVATSRKLVVNYAGLAGVISSGTTLYDSSNNSINLVEFRGSTQNSLRGLSVPVSFYDSSSNVGIINANVTVNSPVTRPIGGTITGTITYLGYDGFYYNNAIADGNFFNTLNWWSNSSFTTRATVPTQYDDVYVSGNMSDFPRGNGLRVAGATRATHTVTLSSAFSVSFWVKTTATGQNMFMGSTNNSNLFYWESGVIQVTTPTGTRWWDYPQATWANGNWHHIVWTVNGATTKVYADNVLLNVTLNNAIGSSFTNQYILGGGFSSYANGDFDEFLIYNKELSASEVSALYGGGAPSQISSYTSVYAAWHLNSSSGTTMTDSSGNGRNLTLTGGSPTWQLGFVPPSSYPFPRVQGLNMATGTNSTTVQTTAGSTFSGTAAHNGTVFGNATFLGDGPTMSASAIASTDTSIKTRSLNFNGINSYGTATAPSITGNTLTISTWAKIDSYTGNYKQIFGSNLAVPTLCPSPPYSQYLFAAYAGSPGGVQFAVSTGGTDRTFLSVANTYAPLNQWAHLTGTYDGTTMKFYVNGVLRASTPKTGNITAAPSGGLTFGSYPCASNRDWFTGGLSDTAIWNVALTDAQVTSLYNSAPDRIGVNPISLWKFDAGSGSTVADSVGGRTATLTSTQWQSAVPPIKYTDNATLTRIYTSDATTTKNFTLNSGRWIIESDGADINLSGATYSVSTTTYQSTKNVFRAKNGATFTENPSINGGAHVVPKVVMNSPISGTNIRWNPDIDWDDADTCQYKWGVDGTYTDVSCAAGGSDIPRPEAFVSKTLYVKGIYNDTSYSEQLTTFTYDNVTPISVDCTTTMDEATREYYYLESDVTGDCTATANITLKGNVNPLLPGYTITGKLIANATSTTDGFNLILSNINITDEINSNGSGSGKRGGSVTLTDSNVANINTNGGAISVTNSVTSQLASNPNTGGIMGGDIVVNFSTTTLIYANGGDVIVSDSNTGLVDSMSPTSGVAGGAVTITDSTTSNITTNGGAISVTNSVTSQLASNSNSGGILGGNITVDVSTTTAIYANGGDITVSTSSVGLLDSTSPTDGIAGGDVEVISSSAGSVTTNGGSVTITDSTISNIDADGISGIASVGAITVTNSTLTDISANGNGSGSRGGHVTVTDSNPTSIATNGGNISLTNVTTGAISANGNTGLSTAATINITNSTTTDITANGGTGGSGVGGNGAAITITNSTVGLVETNGGSSGKRGGAVTITDSTTSNITTNGGAISVTNSVTSQLASNSNSGGILGGNITVDVSTTTAIYANGGDITVSTSSVGLLDSTSPTDGVAGGDITLTNPISTIPSITTNGGDVSLNNVVVIGSITANGNTGGVSAGAISISNSTTTAIYANGGTHSSGNGGNGATITIATSTTGLIEASGADSTGDGGDGGIISIINAIGTNATSTPITANGGDSTSCGNGGDSGVITIVDTTYGTITAEPGVGFNGGCPSDAKSSGIRNTVTTVGQGHSSIPRPAAPTQGNSGAIGGGINPLFRNGLNGLDFTPIQQFNLFGDGSGGGFKPIDAGTTRLPKVFTDLNRLNDFLLDEMPVDILPSLELFVFDEITEDLANLFPNSSNLLAAVGVERSQELASLFRSPRLVSDIENPEKYGLFKVYSGDVVVNTYVAYEQAIENLAQLIKANPSQIIHIGTYVKGKVTDESKTPYIIYQGQKKLMTPTFDGYYATSIIAPNLEGRYLIETSSNVQILLDVLPQNQSNEQSKPWGVFHKLWKIFH